MTAKLVPGSQIITCNGDSPGKNIFLRQLTPTSRISCHTNDDAHEPAKNDDQQNALRSYINAVILRYHRRNLK